MADLVEAGRGVEEKGGVSCWSWIRGLLFRCCHLRPVELQWRWESLLAVLRRRKGWSPLLVVAAAVGARCWLKEADGSAETGEGRRLGGSGSDEESDGELVRGC